MVEGPLRAELDLYPAVLTVNREKQSRQRV
jgi:hypothetical protein